jgi:hypothetical protein
MAAKGPPRDGPVQLERLVCATCGKKFARKKGGKGRKPKHCEKCRRPRGNEQHPEENRERYNARRRARDNADRRNADSEDLNRAAELAAALSVFGNTAIAARYVGIAAVGEELDRLEQLARTAHGEVIEGDLGELGRRIRATIHLCNQRVLEQRAQIAPRDLPHVMRALAQVHDILVGEGKQRFTDIRLFVVGADGKPFEPNAVPQPAAALPETTG